MGLKDAWVLWTSLRTIALDLSVSSNDDSYLYVNSTGLLLYIQVTRKIHVKNRDQETLCNFMSSEVFCFTCYLLFSYPTLGSGTQHWNNKITQTWVADRLGFESFFLIIFPLLNMILSNCLSCKSSLSILYKTKNKVIVTIRWNKRK